MLRVLVDDEVIHHNRYVFIIYHHLIIRQARQVRMMWEPLSSASCRWKERAMKSPTTAGGQRRAFWCPSPALETSGE
jgi:hypothetical protein